MKSFLTIYQRWGLGKSKEKREVFCLDDGPRLTSASEDAAGLAPGGRRLLKSLPWRRRGTTTSALVSAQHEKRPSVLLGEELEEFPEAPGSPGSCPGLAPWKAREGSSVIDEGRGSHFGSFLSTAHIASYQPSSRRYPKLGTDQVPLRCPQKGSPTLRPTQAILTQRMSSIWVSM